MQRWAHVMTERVSTKREEAGFTLAEVLVAVAILFIAVTAILSLMLTNLTMGASATARSAMVNAGNSYVEQLRSMPFDDLSSASLEATTVVTGGYEVVMTPTVTWVDDPRIPGENDYKKVSISLEGTSAGRPSLSTQMEAIIRQEGTVNARKPSVTIGAGSPSGNAIVHGTSIYVAASAVAQEPGATIAAMNFYVDGVPMHSTTGVAQWSASTSPAFNSINWDTTLLDDDSLKRSPDGIRALKFEAWDSNQRSDFRTRMVLVDNHAPQPVTTLEGDSLSAVLASLRWDHTTDGTDYAYRYRFSVRQQPLFVTSSADTGGWTRLSAQGFTVPASPASFTTTPLTRYQFRIRAGSPRGLEGATPDTTLILVSRPSMSGTFTNTKSGSNYAGKVLLAVAGPTFNTTAASATLRRSATPDMANATEYVMAWDGGTGKWTYTDVLPSTKNGSPAYYYQARVNVTPGGYQGGTAMTMSTQVLGPNHPTDPSGTLPLVSW